MKFSRRTIISCFCSVTKSGVSYCSQQTSRKASVLEEALRASAQMARSGSTKGKKEEKRSVDKSKKSEAIEQPSAEAIAAAGSDQANAVSADAQQYVECNTYVIIEMELHRSLVLRRTPEPLAKS